jgi:hypothetical protein
MLGRAGLALGGAVTLGVLNGCSSESDPCPVPEQCPPPVNNAAKIGQFPYQQHLDPAYRLDAAAVREVAYHGYYTGGCCHGAYYGLMKYLADTAGEPFSQLPLDLGMFGGGGVAGYGSMCGAVLAGIMAINQIVPNVANADTTKANVRNRMMTELMRWYEGYAFPVYHPTAVDSHETGLTLGFNDAGLPAVTQVAPGSHLCHTSVTTWCAANANVGTNSGDKKARCSRLTADVAGKVAELLNAYFETGAFTPATTNLTTGCVGCHSTAATAPAAPVASGMECGACHPAPNHPVPVAHPALSNPTPATCDGCH